MAVTVTRKDQYVTVAPVTPKGKWLVCSRRVGTKNRLAPIAECRTEGIADNIVDALNHIQGELVKLDVPAQRVLEEVRGTLVKERQLIDQLRGDLRNAREQLRVAERERDNARRDRDAAAARENA